MKKAVILIMACLLLTGWKTVGYCQDQGGTDDSAIEQSESQIGQNLDSEINSEAASGTADMERADEESQSGEVVL